MIGTAAWHQARLERSPLYIRREHAARVTQQQARLQAWHYVSGERPWIKIVTVCEERDRARE